MAELDGPCRALAVAGALQAGLQLPLTLFVNVEPASVDGTPLLEAAHEARVADGSLRVVFEFTERELTSRPANVLALVERYRRLGYGIALDDVGKDSRSLALIAFLAPDVIKLDLRLIQERTAGSAARTIHAVGAETERSGASVLAEGVETEAHRRKAIAMGARYGQGWLFGRPGPFGASQPNAARRRRQPPASIVGHDTSRLGPWRASPARVADSSSFAIVSANRVTRRADKHLLLELSRQLEVQAGELGPEAVLLAAFQHARFFTPRTAQRYQALAERLALVAAIGADMPPEPAPD